MFDAGRYLPSAFAANTMAVKGADVFTYVHKNMHDVLNVHEKTVNLKETEYMLQILSALYTVRV